MKSVGIDIIEFDKIKIFPELIDRYLTEEEITEFNNLKTDFKKKRFFASKWTLKEAVYKALPFEHLVFSKINITKNKYSQPVVKIKKYKIRLSLSHSQNNVIAIAVVF